MTQEDLRLQEDRERRKHWKRWGPYLAERQWGTVREDYSAAGTAWEYLPHDVARSRAYRWGEDGIGGISDRRQYLCFALSLWNGRDAILKERLFGLSGNEGNHGEDVKEYYFYLDSTPTHSYMKFLYKYPQSEFPYNTLVEESRRRGRGEPEFELIDTGAFDTDRYFDVFIEYAKAAPDDILIRIQAINRGPDAAELHLLPTLWFRNTWSWGSDPRKPQISRDVRTEVATLAAEHHYYGQRRLYCAGNPELIFTENETNAARLYGAAHSPRYAKDGINDYVVHGDASAVSSIGPGTKAAARYRLSLGTGERAVLRLRLTDDVSGDGVPLDGGFDSLFALRAAEADEFYAAIIPASAPADAKAVMRQALGGLLWSKQFYFYDVNQWLEGDPASPPPPRERLKGRNHQWRHLYNADVISMPDKWEYPWYAAWDLAFHCIPLALVDAQFAKEQLILMLREWYMHPNGQIPAYEWAFGDVNPPVHAWAAWRVYKVEKRLGGRGDHAFLERVFHKLLLNFTWWVNRKDAGGRNIFQGGFLGLDNIGVFDRSKPLPGGRHLEQSDGTAWMAMYTLNLLAIALELSRENAAYEDVASKFWEHFVYIAHAISHRGDEQVGLWDDEDGFFYDVLRSYDGTPQPMKIRSMVGLIPLFAVETLNSELLESLPGFKRRMQWFLDNRPDLTRNLASFTTPGIAERRLLSITNAGQLRRILSTMLDEKEFLSPYGIRALSRYHQSNPYCLSIDGMNHCVGYEPAESSSGLFGGNSNWRGPVWFPVNFLLIESLQKFHFYYGDTFKVECPTGSGNMMTLWEVAGELSRRLMNLFTRGSDGRRAVYGNVAKFQVDPHWCDLVPFYEYFHGDTGAGLGASHQTGWTALVAKLIQQYYREPASR